MRAREASGLQEQERSGIVRVSGGCYTARPRVQIRAALSENEQSAQRKFRLSV